MGSKRLLSIDPDGTEKWFVHDPIAKTNTIHYEHHDLEPILDYAHALRMATDYSKKGIKRGWWHYAHIPNIIIAKLRFEYGLNVWDNNHKKRIFEVLNRDFPKLKLTEGFHVPN